LGNLHGAEWLAVHPLAGVATGRADLSPAKRGAVLRLRVRADRLGDVLPLAGKTLDVAGVKLHLGTSQIYELQPSTSLRSRIVVIKGYTEPDLFGPRLARELESKNVTASVELGRRRVIRIDGRKIVGFEVTLSNLSEPDSLTILNEGLGGRQRFGCGVFRQVRASQ
jgi:CRISPR-associated endonuclease/helicase Cas3